MKRFSFIIILTVMFSFGAVSVMSCGGNKSSNATEQTGKEYTSAYVCPMHCEGSGSSEPGKCPVCGMEYVKNEDHKGDD